MVDYSSNANIRSGGLKIRYILILLLIAFIGGAGIAYWAADHYGLMVYQKTMTNAPVSNQTTPALIPPKAASTEAPSAAANSQVDALEGRMTQINADAMAASGNATRAEGMLIAFAARRAIDSGAPLGYVEDQLRLRFGGSQPQAVATILGAAAAPVTLSGLQSELNTLGDSLTTTQGGGMLAKAKRELSELFVLRKEGTPSPAPTQKLKRAKSDADAGNIAAAIAEVKTLPGAALAKGWIAKAQRYVDTHKALDIIERSAIMVPVAVPVAPPQQIPNQELQPVMTPEADKIP